MFERNERTGQVVPGRRQVTLCQTRDHERPMLLVFQLYGRF